MAARGGADDRVHVLGVRHHGPGSARAVHAALVRLRPDAVLIEGPPEADALVELAADPDMVPPVALLGYRDDDPSRAAFWPFAEFSPEWQALRYAVTRDVPVRFCDLPAAHTLAWEAEAAPVPAAVDAPDDPEAEAPDGAEDDGGAAEARAARTDPIAVLARTAGYDDPERWWEDVVEHRDDGESPFPAIAAAMEVLRETAESAGPGPDDAREAAREAHMRKVLRAALREGFQRIAVVCGAWHAPALRTLPSAAADAAALRGLPKAKVSVTWVPWTHGRLAAASGYGAGVTAPGWYHHLFTAADRPVLRWLTEAARLLREEDQPVSSAHVIEAVRLAESLAVLRGRPLAGLSEVAEATTAVLCEGAEARAALVHRRMVVGERLGEVPAATPALPIQRDLREAQRRLRLRPEATVRDIELDLRKDLDLQRSRLLNRLLLLGVRWGAPRRGDRRRRGTFAETWSLAWQPEFDVALVEAGRWGTTVASAAAARVRELAAEAALPALTRLTEECLRAGLDGALGEVVAAVSRRAAVDTDITHLMAALPPLARAQRYGGVRRHDASSLRAVTDELLTRVCVGLGPALAAAAPAGSSARRPASGGGATAKEAARTVELVDGVHAATGLLGEADRSRWLDTLAECAARSGVEGLVAGRLHRLLHDACRLGGDELVVRFGHATAAAEPPARAAAWIEGFVGGAGAGGGLLLVHDTELLGLVDRWLSGLGADAFGEVLPLLRRAFGAFAPPERRAIGEQARRLGGGPAGRTESVSGGHPVDDERAAPAVATVLRLLAPAAASPVPSPSLQESR
ncbi:DUF5682 family protein [Allonocardiopsis opalescens]|uniref:Uncharacterized protein n=1 Tax=Allonocardiopsis opalescens TaxID=1144618 RepID=A0A2T0PXW8_9ACTN|nr:DUF5682 family protein [Allonocardiopsis opalescens]PRX96298.1 hypothetical protein CLV72_108305 [Allonocardiopsis opalescens]